MPETSNYRRKVGEAACRGKRDGHQNSMHKQAWLSAPAYGGKLEKLMCRPVPSVLRPVCAGSHIGMTVKRVHSNHPDEVLPPCQK